MAKSTSLDRLFGPAWLAFGHSFAIENEHDQAMAAYFKASQLMKGYTFLNLNLHKLILNFLLQMPFAFIVYRIRVWAYKQCKIS